MIFAVGIAVVGGALIVKKLKARRHTSAPMIDASVAPSASTPPTDTAVASLAPKPLLDINNIPVEQHLLLSSGTLGLRLISLAGVPFVGPFSLVSLMYLDLYFLSRAYVEWQTESATGVTDAVVATGLLLTRQFGADALFATTFFVSRKLTQQTKVNLAQRLGGYPTLASQPAQSAPSGPHEVFAEEAPFALAKAEPESAPPPMKWQTLIRQGTLPFLTLSTLSLPFIGAKRSLAVLLTNFGYDYRVTAPLSTLTHMDLAAQHEIVVGDWRAFEKLGQVDVVLLDEQFFGNAATEQNSAEPNDLALAYLPLLQQLQQTGQREWILIGKAPMTPESAALLPNITTIAPHEAPGLLKQLHAAKRTVCLVRGAAQLVIDPSDADTAAADVVVTLRDPQTMLTSLEQLAHEKAHIGLSTSSPEQLLTLFQLADRLAHTLKRGLALTLLPSVLSLGGIYLFHFGPVTALLLDSTALAAGVVNAQWTRLGSQPPDTTSHVAEGEKAMPAH